MCMYVAQELQILCRSSFLAQGHWKVTREPCATFDSEHHSIREPTGNLPAHGACRALPSMAQHANRADASWHMHQQPASAPLYIRTCSLLGASSSPTVVANSN